MGDKSNRLEDIGDVKTWIAEHDGRINAYWEQQRALNERFEGRLDMFAARLLALEKKVMWFAGVAAAAGGIFGSAISKGFIG